MDINELLTRRREAILRIAAKHGASNVRVFGSVARGQARRNSDVDFLVKLGRGRSLLDQAGMIVELEDLLKRKIDVAAEDGLKDRIRARILAEAIPL